AEEEDEERGEPLEVAARELRVVSVPRGAKDARERERHEREERGRSEEPRVGEEVDLQVARPREALVLDRRDPLHRAVARAEERPLAEEVERRLVAPEADRDVRVLGEASEGGELPEDAAPRVADGGRRQPQRR